MSDIYNKNLELMKKYRPQFFEDYQQNIDREDYEYFCEKIEVIEARDGSKIFSVSRKGKQIRLNSIYKPIREAEQWASQFNLNSIKARVMLFGLGNGMFAEAILNRMEDSDAVLMIYEPSLQIFNKAIHCIDLERLIKDDRVVFCINDLHSGKLRSIIGYFTHWTTLNSQVNCYHTGYEQLFFDAYQKFAAGLRKEAANAMVNKNTQEYFSKKMVENMIKNMKFLKSASLISAYEDEFSRDIPFIIVSAGPSLDKNIHQLKRAKGKAFIMAVDTAMRSLLREGIYPDAMITLDPGKPFSYMDNPALKEIPLFCVLESNSEIMDFHKGLKIWFDGSSFLGKLFADYGKKFLSYSVGGSVATGAFMVGASLNFRRIILVGQDLAYQGNTTHAGGQTDRGIDEEENVYVIEGIDGQMVKSRPDWMAYRDWFEQAILFLEDKEIEVIDATEGGALIHGSKIMKLKDVIDQYCNEVVDIEKKLKQAGPTFNEKEYKRLSEEIRMYKDDMQIIRRQAEKGEKYCSKIIQMINRNEKNEEILKLQNSVREIINEIQKKNVYAFVDIYMSKEVDKYLDGIFMLSQDEKENEKVTYQKARRIFQCVKQNAYELISIIQKNL